MAEQKIVALEAIQFDKIAKDKEGTIKYGSSSSYEDTGIVFTATGADIIHSDIVDRSSVLYKKDGKSIIISLPKGFAPPEDKEDEFKFKLFVYRVGETTTLNGTEVVEGTLKFRAVEEDEEYNSDEFKFTKEEQKAMNKRRKEKAKEMA